MFKLYWDYTTTWTAAVSHIIQLAIQKDGSFNLSFWRWYSCNSERKLNIKYTPWQFKCAWLNHNSK